MENHNTGLENFQVETIKELRPEEAPVENTQLQSQKPVYKAFEQEEAPAISFSKLYTFTTTKDKILMFFGFVTAALNGACMPGLTLVFGNIATVTAGSTHDLIHKAGIVSIEFFAIGVFSFLMSYLSFASWMIIGEKQAIEIRKRYFRSLLKQEIAFFDSINPNELSTKIADECKTIEEGIGEKVATFSYSLTMFIAGFIIAYIKGWQLALVCTGVVPFIIIAGTLFVFAIQKQTTFTSNSYSKAGAISEQALNAIRTVVALGGQEKEVNRYNDALEKHGKVVVQFATLSGLAFGFVGFMVFGLYALGYWTGSKFIQNGIENPISNRPYNQGDVLTIVFSIMIAGFSFSQVTPALKNFAMAKAAGAKAFQIINRKSMISFEDDHGLKPETITGQVEFNNVVFAYPTKPDRVILNGISFTARPNEKIALVGESGCGKTTCIQLIERFYDFDQGAVTIDGNEVKNINLKWLRENIGYVGQEPVLFATSIRENLLLAKENASDDEVWDALTKANAAEFVRSLPEDLNTNLGNNATQLSGGQKQRLAIARAILKNPRILLLDEATSALDRKNEMEIQKTLDSISEGRTTISIAHRLTTIQNADRIIVFDKGHIVEEGTHKDLITKKGKYYALQHLQLQAAIQEEDNEEDDEQLEEELADLDPKENSVQFDVPNEREEMALQVEQSRIMENEENLEVAQENIRNLRMQLSRKRSSRSKKVSQGKNLTENAGRQDLELDIKDPDVVALEIGTEDLNDKKKNKSKKKGDGKAKKPKEVKHHITSRLLKYNSEKKWLLIFGLIFAALNGAAFPMTAILISRMLATLANPSQPNFRHKIDIYVVYFIVLGIAALVFSGIQLALLNIVGNHLSKKLRIAVFQKYLTMDIGWHDLPENNAGVLISRLSTEASLVDSLASTLLGVFTQAFSSFIAGSVIAFCASWQLTLISLALSPIIVIGGKIQADFKKGFTADSDVAYRESSAFVTEAVNNMRTVASFAREDKLLKNYNDKLAEPMRLSIRKGNLTGLGFGFSQFGIFFVYAIIFLIGAVFQVKIGLTFQNLFQTIFGVVFAAFGAGNAMQFAPDIDGARTGAIHIFETLDAVPQIRMNDPEQTELKPITGDIEFRNVWFRYPTRPKDILRGLNFKISSNSKVAFVGPSGCGKSTVMSLLLRYYNPQQGEILIDGIDIKKYNLKQLRDSFGVVSQEPTLFNGTIEYNIR